MNANEQKYQQAQDPDLAHQKQVEVCSHLKKLRADFIRAAIVSGPCRAKSIPKKFKPKNQDLPDDFEGRLVISYRESHYNLVFFSMDGKQEFRWQIKNDGLENYKKMLDAIWNVETGLQHRYPEDSFGAVWIVKKRMHGVLNREVKRIDELLEPLFAIKEYSEWAGEVRAKIRYNASLWSGKGEVVSWSYLKWLDEIIVGPAGEPKQKNAPAKSESESGWWKLYEKTVKPFWDSLLGKT